MDLPKTNKNKIFFNFSKNVFIMLQYTDNDIKNQVNS